MQIKGKKWVLIFIFILALCSFSFQLSVENQNFQNEEKVQIGQGQSVFISGREDVKTWDNFIEGEISSGNLKLTTTQTEDLGSFVHQRYDFYYHGIKVWGAQLIRHLRNGKAYCINGRYYEDIGISVIPSIAKEDAVEIAKDDLVEIGHILEDVPELIIFPAKEKFYLAYKIKLTKFDSQMIYFINAWTGEVIFKYNNVKTDAAVGLGSGTLNDKKKLSTEYKDNQYWAIDIMRPAKLITADMWHSEDINNAYYIIDDDNYWTDSASVDAHAYIGWVYDYFYLIHNRKGMNDANMVHAICVHLGTNYSNAFYHPSTNYIYFGDGNPSTEYPICTALDVVAHEFTHGITQHTSNLIYAFESGALNEAFSDIMGVSCEFFHQPEGNGYLKAEWWEGEDFQKVFQAGRDLSDPARIFIVPEWGWTYPDHYSMRYLLPYDYDNGGVHINMTIVTHWYYLLANGGTNKTSWIYINGIGLNKAEKIAYRTWVYYLFPSAYFSDARWASIQAATDLYGAGSTEVSQVAQVWNAVGVLY